MDNMEQWEIDLENKLANTFGKRTEPHTFDIICGTEMYKKLNEMFEELFKKQKDVKL